MFAKVHKLHTLAALEAGSLPARDNWKTEALEFSTYGAWRRLAGQRPPIKAYGAVELRSQTALISIGVYWMNLSFG